MPYPGINSENYPSIDPVMLVKSVIEEQQEQDPERFAREWAITQRLGEVGVGTAPTDINFTPNYQHRFQVPGLVAMEAKELVTQVALECDGPKREIEQIRQHLMRTSLAGITFALYRGRSEEQATRIGRAQMMDDSGKIDESVFGAITSPLKLYEDPTLFPRIVRHSFVGVYLMHEAGADPVEIIMCGNHHSRAPKGRETYVVFDDVSTVTDIATGEEVDVGDLLEDAQLTDMLDALHDPTRAYRADQPHGYPHALSILEKDEVPVTGRAMQVLRDILPIAA
jgi:hypothetical protein